MTEHILSLVNRSAMELTDVINVLTFDEQEIILETSLGNLFISGEDLHITMLNLDGGKVAIQGSINTLSYIAPGTHLNVKINNIVTRLFK